MIRASQVLFWFGLTVATSVALYHTSDRTRELERALRSTNTAIEAEQQKIHVLNAEWTFLANPARVEEQAKKYLTALRPTIPRQVIDLADFEQALPTRQQKAAAAVTAPPIAVVKAAAAKTPPGPVKTAQAASPPIIQTPAKARKVATAAPHINDRMILQHASVTIPPVNAKPGDKIGALIAELGTHP